MGQVQDYFRHPHAFVFYPPARNHHNPVRMRMQQFMVKRIETGTPEGDALGFFEHLFSGWLETRNDNRLYLHYIISRNRNEGNTQALLRQWLFDGYDVRVVMPRPVMQHILKKYQFIPSREYFPGEYEDNVEVWFRAGFRQPGDVQIPPAGKADPGCCCSPVTARAVTSK